jgi:hypothetical protein
MSIQAKQGLTICAKGDTAQNKKRYAILAGKGRRFGLARRGRKEDAGLAQEKFEEPIISETP